MGQSAVIPVGIDLGTTFSVVAHLDAQGRPWTVRNAEGDTTTPSVVFFDRADTIVGKEALKAASLEPDRIAACVKRDMGNTTYGKSIHGHQLPPEVIESFILKKLKADAELTLGPFKKVVITVPAYFDEPRRKATQDAGRLAGLEVIDIINEPTAAALAYGVQRGFLGTEGMAQEKELLLVYDLGGGTFDVTLMEIEGKDYRTLSTAGDVFLGGMDWDARIVAYVAEEFQEMHGGDDLRNDPAALALLAKEAEDAKRALTARDSVNIAFQHNGVGIRVPLSRQDFEEGTSDLLERTRFTCNRVIKDAGLRWSDLTRLLVVGGSTRMPMILRMLEEESGHTIDRSLSADEAVAHGAAIYAGVLLADESQREKLKVGTVSNVNSHDLGVLAVEPQTGRPRRKVLIPRNTPLPVSRSSLFVTHRENQPSVVVKVIEGGDASGTNATPIGKCVISDLPANLPAKTPVEVVFSYSGDGRLTVEARLPDIGCEASLAIERASGMDDRTLKQWEDKLEAGLVIDDDEEAEGLPVVGETGDDVQQAPEAESDETADGIPFFAPNRSKPAATDDDALQDFLGGLK